MLAISDNTLNIINSPVRSIEARVELYNSSALVNTFNHNGALISFTVDRVGENSKFFGFGVSQKINIHLIDKDRELSITTDNYFKVIYTIGEEDIAPYPYFYVTEVHRDENTNELSITAYDALYAATAHNSAEMALFNPTEEEVETVADTTEIKIEDYISSCADVLGLIEDPAILSSGEWQNISYTDTTEVNLEGTETIKDVLDDIAEVSHSIYYIDNNNALCFKALGASEPVEVDKAKYITLTSAENRRLATITHSTELADNISVTTGATGTTQYLRSNCFIELNVDNTTLILNELLSTTGDFTINQFECEWVGNPALEIGETLQLTTKDNNTVISYLLNDTTEYTGALKEKTSWTYEEAEEESADNPATLGEALKQTFAKVDKANKEITMLTSQTDENTKDISQLKLDTEGIAATVSNSQTSIEELTGSIKEIQEDVSAKMTSDAVKLEINKAISEGVNTVKTTTGFTFNDDGLTIARSGSEMSTTIDEDGMVVSNSSEEVLTATSEGVNAINLTARQYLVIGKYSRFQDYGTRTGCFWIGG